MIEFEALRHETEAMEEPLADLREALHIRQTEDEADELEARSQEPGFWDDPQEAGKVQTRIAHLRRRVTDFSALVERLENLAVLIELGDEAEDADLLAEAESELETLKADYEALRLETLFIGEHDENNAIVSLHAGAGGTEAQDWAEMLYRMYTRWAEKHGFTLSELDYLDGDEAGLKSVSFSVSGEHAYGYLRSEGGVHRLVRISPFDSAGRRHTSFASVEVMPELDDSIQIEIRPEDIKMDVYRASGAGGQHVNKTSSAVRLTHLPTGVVVACQAERSQFQNRDKAMEMLKAKLFAIAEAAQMDRIEDLKGNQMEIAWGSQIRSYVFCPYTLVSDHRTGHKEGDVDAVMDGEIDPFIQSWLAMKAGTRQNEEAAI
ncbi:MAG: peptide chain release factor 2 [Bacillota bacterium]|nr:peptide chain release factor 2 [Bacillota bacterium]